MSEKCVYSPDFFHCQGTFALKLYQVLLEAGVQISFEEVLRYNTTLHREVTHQGQSQPGVAAWDQIMREVQQIPGIPLDYLINQLYLSYITYANKIDLTQTEKPSLRIEWVPELKVLQTHYVPSSLNGKSTLSFANRAHRLRTYFKNIQQLIQLYPEDTKVLGYSWLYNIESYTWLLPEFQGYFNKHGQQLKDTPSGNYQAGKRLYPQHDARYVQGEAPMPLQSWSIWGQFLHHGFKTNAAQAEEFEQKVATAVSVEALTDTFPHPTRYYESTLGHWWQHLKQLLKSG